MPLGPSLDPFPIKQVANGRGGARQLQTDSVPSPVWLSLEDITKEDHSSMAQSVNTACGYVSSSANASRPQAEPLTLRGIKTWPDSRPPPGPGGGTLDGKAIGCWASVTRGGGCRSQPRACRDCAPPPQHAGWTPAAQRVPLRAVLRPPPRNFLSQGDSWGRGSGLVLLSDLQPIWE